MQRGSQTWCRLSIFGLAALVAVSGFSATEKPVDLQVRAFAIAAPPPDLVDDFVSFVVNELIPNNVNALVLRVDYNFQYQSHPELRDEVALSLTDVRKITDACRQGGIRVIPQINLLGHQSWHVELMNLLEVYPQFDETPHIELPDSYVWPNPDGLYCKSYCPLHPELHEVVFALVDEIVEAYQTDAFHAGMDEVFYIGDDNCPRCAGLDKAELFAGEVTRIRNHLAKNGVELWIWGDRLIDGATTGIGMWEASMNRTHRAVDLIPKDVVICDWHYEKPLPTAAYFAIKGFRVISCPWNRSEVALGQLELMAAFKASSSPQMSSRYLGAMQTIWSKPGDFLDQYYGRNEPDRSNGDPIACTKTFLAAIKN
jgi:hypothetical protein